MRNPYLVLALALMASGCDGVSGESDGFQRFVRATEARVGRAAECEARGGVLVVTRSPDPDFMFGEICADSAIEVAHTDTSEASE